MTTAWRSWLPDDATAPPAAQRALTELVEDWSREWFPGDPMRVTGPLSRAAAPRSELRKTVWHGYDEDVAIGLPPSGLAMLGAMVLGVSAAAGQRDDKDLVLLEALGEACLGGLKSRLVQCLALGKPAWRRSEAGRGEEGAHRLEVVTPARALAIQIEISAAGFARFVRAKLPDPAQGARLGSGAAALAHIPISLSALLGRCRLTLAELSGLGTGDVIVLESRLEDILPLAVGCAPLARGRCAVVEAGQGPALKIVQAPVQ